MKQTKKAVRVPRAATIIRGIETPPGFEREVTIIDLGWGDVPNVVDCLKLTSPDVRIEIHFTGGRKSYELASGHVYFDTNLGERTLDRTGVEDSFYIDNPLKWSKETLERYGSADPIVAANEKIRKIVTETVPQAQARINRSERVPTIPFTVTPERKAEITELLQSGKTHTFTPSGFGTGYRLTTRRSQWTRPGPAELAKFFGVRAVHLERLDCD